MNADQRDFSTFGDVKLYEPNSTNSTFTFRNETQEIVCSRIERFNAMYYGITVRLLSIASGSRRGLWPR
jgi:hypothetical protein